MDKIASPLELIAALEDLLDYAQTERPSRELIASELTELSERVAARFVMPRSSYLPEEVRGKDPIVPEGTDLAIWTWEGQGNFYGICFVAKQSKPLWHYRFRSEAAREAEIKKTIESRKKSLEYKNQKVLERKNFKHTMKEGDILYSSWGYDQTNVEFYQVVAVGDATVKIREIGSKVVKSDSSADYVSAVPNNFQGPAMTKRVSPSNSIRLNSFSSARPWDGKPKYQTGAYAGH